MRSVTIALLVLATLLGACAPGAVVSSPATTTPAPVPPTDAQAVAPPAPGATHSLTAWLPPDLSPDGTGEAARLLSERLQAFLEVHPGVHLEVRIKGRSGPAGMTEALAAAHEAAPSVLPDLVAVDATQLATAAAAGLILPWQDASAVDETWGLSDPILVSARAAGKLAGLPVGAEADLFAYDSLAYTAAPRTWTDLLTANAAFLIPIGDPSALFTMAQYLAEGGTLRDAQGAATLDRPALQQVLSFFAAARAGGLLPLTSRQHADSRTTGEALLGGRIDAALIPFSRFVASTRGDVRPAGLWPTGDGQGTCFLYAWTWALAARPSGPDPLAIELAQWLAEPEFSGPWTRALGMIPAGEAALGTWPADDLRSLAGMLATRCAPQPPAEDLALFGPIFRQAAEAALTGEMAPEAAAARAADELSKR